MVESENGRICVYNLREGRRKEIMETQINRISCMCVVDIVLYACSFLGRLVWLHTKLNAWRRLVSRDGKTLDAKFHEAAMAEYDGKLAVFSPGNKVDPKKKEIRCGLIAFGGRICRTFEWSGVVARIPYTCIFQHYLAVSD